MSYLVDTNFLLRLIHPQDALRSVARNAYLRLYRQDEELCIVPQNLVEFWSVATRPERVNGLGVSVEVAFRRLNSFKRLFTLKEDSSAIQPTWEMLVWKYQVQGKQAHDTRLVAAMLSHQISSILTFNPADFRRFTEIQVIDPATLITS